MNFASKSSLVKNTILVNQICEKNEVEDRKNALIEWKNRHSKSKLSISSDKTISNRLSSGSDYKNNESLLSEKTNFKNRLSTGSDQTKDEDLSQRLKILEDRMEMMFS